MLIPISYPLNRATPLNPGTEPLAISRTKSFEEGDAEEKSLITFSSHAGTHIDLPRHVCPGAGSVRSLLAPEAVFEPARCIAIPKTGAEPIRNLRPPSPPRRDQDVARALCPDRQRPAPGG